MLLLIYLLVFLALAALLWAGTTWFQGYIYSEPAEQLYWRAPAAAAGVTLFLAFWGFLAYRAPGDYPAQFQFEAQGKPQEFAKMKAVYADRTIEVRRAAGQNHYVDSQNQRMPSRPFAVIVAEDGEEARFEADRNEKGHFVTDPIHGLSYRDAKKRVMKETELGSLPTSRKGLLFVNILLYLTHLGVWFLCCWLLLQYQWTHALGIAAVLWLIMTISVAEMLVQRVERAKKERSQVASVAASLREAATGCA